MSEWKPIETAPKDGARILLYFPVFGNSACKEFGYWEIQKHHKNPKPYWTGDRERIFGVLWYRNQQPTHWMILEDPTK